MPHFGRSSGWQSCFGGWMPDGKAHLLSASKGMSACLLVLKVEQQGCALYQQVLAPTPQQSAPQPQQQPRPHPQMTAVQSFGLRSDPVVAALTHAQASSSYDWSQRKASFICAVLCCAVNGQPAEHHLMAVVGRC